MYQRSQVDSANANLEMVVLSGGRPTGCRPTKPRCQDPVASLKATTGKHDNLLPKSWLLRLREFYNKVVVAAVWTRNSSIVTEALELNEDSQPLYNSSTITLKLSNNVILCPSILHFANFLQKYSFQLTSICTRNVLQYLHSSAGPTKFQS